MTQIREYSAAEVGVTHRDISPNALKVVSRLQEAGFDSYLVGGCVRDLMIGKKPKDFDIATAAHPEEIKQLFNNCRLIGRRFRLAHIRFGREIIEVATFRGHHGNAPKGCKNTASTSDQGMILRDNVYGSVEEDAVRRDFTINALYYDPFKATVENDSQSQPSNEGVVKDFVDSREDINAKQIRLIGDPEQRYREDPVRMLRAVRFAAKLQFNIEAASDKAIHQLAQQLAEIPAARLFEEMQKLFLCGHALDAVRRLDDFGLLDVLFPLTVKQYRQDEINRKLIEQALINTDNRLAENKHVTPSFLLAVLLWGPMLQRKQRYIDQGLAAQVAMNQASHEVIQFQSQVTSIPKRFGIPAREMWDLQWRLPKRFGRRAEMLIQHPRFRAAYDFLLLRELAGEVEPGLGQWWTDYQEADASAQKQMLRELNENDPKRRRPPRKRKRFNG